MTGNSRFAVYRLYIDVVKYSRFYGVTYGRNAVAVSVKEEVAVFIGEPESGVADQGCLP